MIHMLFSVLKKLISDVFEGPDGTSLFPAPGQNKLPASETPQHHKYFGVSTKWVLGGVLVGCRWCSCLPTGRICACCSTFEVRRVDLVATTVQTTDIHSSTLTELMVWPLCALPLIDCRRSWKATTSTHLPDICQTGQGCAESALSPTYKVRTCTTV